MNAKSITLSICVLIGLIFAAHALTYTISVTTGSGFPATKGNLYVILKSPNQVNNVSMGALFNIAPNLQYTSVANSPIPAPQLSSAVFQWINRQSRGGSITLQQVTVVPSYLQEPFRSQFTKRFCAYGAIPTVTPRTMVRC